MQQVDQFGFVFKIDTGVVQMLKPGHCVLNCIFDFVSNIHFDYPNENGGRDG